MRAAVLGAKVQIGLRPVQSWMTESMTASRAEWMMLPRMAGGGSFKLKGKPETGRMLREMHYFR